MHCQRRGTKPSTPTTPPIPAAPRPSNGVPRGRLRPGLSGPVRGLPTLPDMGRGPLSPGTCWAAHELSRAAADRACGKASLAHSPAAQVSVLRASPSPLPAWRAAAPPTTHEGSRSRPGPVGLPAGWRTGAVRAGASRPPHGASPAPPPRSALLPLPRAPLPHGAAAAQEMRRGGSRREPALSPPKRWVGRQCHRRPRFLPIQRQSPLPWPPGRATVSLLTAVAAPTQTDCRRVCLATER